MWTSNATTIGFGRLVMVMVFGGWSLEFGGSYYLDKQLCIVIIHLVNISHYASRAAALGMFSKTPPYLAILVVVLVILLAFLQCRHRRDGQIPSSEIEIDFA